MTLSKDYDALINAQCVIMAESQNLLNSTDYKVVREMEGGEPEPEEDKIARAEARTIIQNARVEIARLEEEKRQEEERQPE